VQRHQEYGATAQRRPESEPGWYKVAGLLAEMDVAEGRVRYVVLGVGLNVNQADFPPELPQAASLRMLGQGEQDRYALLERLLPALERRIAQVRTAREEVLAAWIERSATVGQPVRVGDLCGIAEGVRADGALLLRLASGRLVPVLAGDVLFAGPSDGPHDAE
jgi:BirA family biotin operon repressor/biotin-[acetyl-CoA-carboxylase] ligase